MSEIILSFFTPNSTSPVEYRARVDTLDPICEIVEDDEEPDFPPFENATGLDSTYQAQDGVGQYIYDIQVNTVPSLEEAKAILEPFLIEQFNIKLLSIHPLI